MLRQAIALCAAIAYAVSFTLSKCGLHYSTPITITFVSLLMQTIVLCGIAVAITGIPSTTPFVFFLFTVAGVLQAVVRQLTYIGIEKIGATRNGPIRASVPLWNATGVRLASTKRRYNYFRSVSRLLFSISRSTCRDFSTVYLSLSFSCTNDSRSLDRVRFSSAIF